MICKIYKRSKEHLLIGSNTIKDIEDIEKSDY